MFQPLDSRCRIRWIVGIVLCTCGLSFAQAAKLTMKDGRIETGRIGMTASVAEDPNNPTRLPGGVDLQPILILDDGLRRIFVPKSAYVELTDAGDEPQERIRIDQPNVLSAGSRIGGVGPAAQITQFDEFGRRVYRMKTARKLVDVIQGITLVTPTYCTVESLAGTSPAVVWRMRIATSSIPRDTLSKILARQIAEDNSEDRLKIVRLYLQAGRYQDARTELERVVDDFPELKQLAAEVQALRQLGARRVLEEIQLRMSAGQHAFAQGLLAEFPSESVAGETLEQVREILHSYQSQTKQAQEAIRRIDELIGAVNQDALTDRIGPIREEIAAELRFNTLDRLAAFLRLADDKTLNTEQKLALAISGWLVGSNDATEDLRVALSLFDVRNAVVRYLREPIEQQRSAIRASLTSQEAATPRLVAQLIRHIKPPLATDEETTGAEGHYRLSVGGLEGEPDVVYDVQLPPEYDPYRRYPAVVTLHGGGSSPVLQLDWWAGAVVDGRRQGQGMRHGYVTIAVHWQKPYQAEYKYSAREHHAVLASLRDACRRFSIDTDRVFLSGHDTGGDAAWDIGLAHPDLWAGVLPVVAVGERFCAHYWRNAQYVPFYFVAGELDGDRMARNSREFDRYLRGKFDATVVEYRGRGHEHFYDEIQRIFDWMSRRERDFYPREFSCATMRTWDNFFWWVELGEFPPRSTVDPADWPPPRGTRPLRIEASINESGGVLVRPGGRKMTVWLAPELVDFQERVTVSLGNRRVAGRASSVSPDLGVILEDVRTRGDRQHPFWAKVESP